MSDAAERQDTSTDSAAPAVVAVEPDRSNRTGRSDRDRDRDRDDRDRDRDDRDRGRDRGSDRDRDRDRDRHRGGSGRDHRDERRDRDYRPSTTTPAENGATDTAPTSGTKDRDRDAERERSPKRGSERAPRMSKEEEEAAKKARDENTVFVQQVHPKVDEMDLLQYFSACGQVDDVKLIKDQRTGRSKGMAYITFNQRESIIAAVALNGQMIGGFPITIQSNEMVKPRIPNKEKDREVNGPFKLSVSNLHLSLVDSDLKPIFQAFGDLESCELHRDGRAKSKGTATVQYKKRGDAITAQQGLNGFELMDMEIVVKCEFAQEELKPRAPVLPTNPFAAAVAAPHAAAFLATQTAPGGVALTVPSPQFVLKNMFDPATMADEDEWLDLQEDVQEAAGADGQVVLVHVDRASMGNVFVKMVMVDDAVKTVTKMNGRYYSKRLIAAEYLTESQFSLLVPSAAAAATADQ